MTVIKGCNKTVDICFHVSCESMNYFSGGESDNASKGIIGVCRSVDDYYLLVLVSISDST